MLRRCYFCGQSLAQQGEFERQRAPGRVAFDPERGRAWTICGRCHGWNLWLLEDRQWALPALERGASRARLLYQTENVALLDAEGLELVRVGKTELPEEAWWRYGRELRSRRVRYQSPVSKVGVATYAALSCIGSNLGLAGITGDFHLDDDLYANVTRWRRFGNTAWRGRAPCPACHSVLIKLFFYKSKFLILLSAEGDQLAIGIPCARCDPWDFDKLHRLDGPVAERVLRRALAYQNVDGASPAEIDAAVRMIEAAGSPQQLIHQLAAERLSLSGLKRVGSLALEISVNENAERRQLARESAEIEMAWRQAEEVAAIIDGELSEEQPAGRGRLSADPESA